MTKEEITAMKPGRDLDIKVAITIMGYIWLTHLIHFSEEMTVKWLGTQADIIASKGAFVAVKSEKVYDLKLRDKYEEAVPRYSTDVIAAQQIVDKLAIMGHSLPAGLNPEEICKVALERTALSD